VKRSFEKAETNPATAWISTRDGQLGVVGEAGLLTVWDIETGGLSWEAQSSGNPGGEARVSSEGRWLATVVNEQEVDLWNLRERKLTVTLERHVYPVTTLAFSKDGRWLATGDASGMAWLWPLRLAVREPLKAGLAGSDE
jgi:WD40 repeat protein